MATNVHRPTSTTSVHRPNLSVAVLGQVDGGKSTVLGHLRYQCGCVSQREMDRLAQESLDLGKGSFKFAWISDKRQPERERGITIEATELQMFTPKYDLQLVDTPGHKSFMKNAVAGVATADHAMLVIDASAGAYEAGMTNNGATKEHALVAFAMGAKQLIVAVNKMDALETPYDQARFDEITTEVGEYLARCGYQNENIQYIPVAGWDGENLTTKSARMTWYTGATLLEAFDNLTPPPRAVDKPFRMPVQDVYKIGGIGLVVTGRVQTGVLKRGMQLSFGPTGAKGTVFSIESNHCQFNEAYPGMAVGINIKGLTAHDIKRGYVASDASCDEARAVTEFTAQLVFLRPREGMLVQAGYSPVVHCHTTQVTSQIHEITATIDRQTGEVLARPTDDERLTGKSGDACLVTFYPSKPVVLEAFREYPSLGRVVVRDSGATMAIGVIRSVVKKGVGRP